MRRQRSGRIGDADWPVWRNSAAPSACERWGVDCGPAFA